MATVDGDNTKTDKVIDRFYAFISYKHFDGKQLFKEDEYWARGLAKELGLMQIPVNSDPPLDETRFIHRNPKDTRVSPVFRDGAQWGVSQDLREDIKKALRGSQTLVSVISDDMINNQDTLFLKREKGIICDTPYCYDEIEYFLSVEGHSIKDIIPIYIEKKKVGIIKDILPLPIIRKLLGNDKITRDYPLSPNEREILDNYKPICIYDEVYDKETSWRSSKDNLVKWGAAKVAATIFHTHVRAFLTYLEQQEAANKKRIRRILWPSAVAIMLFAVAAIVMWGRERPSRAKRYMVQANESYLEGNIPQAARLSVAAEKTGAYRREIKDFQWKLYENDYTKPIRLIKRMNLLAAPNNEIWEVDMEHGWMSLINGQSKGETVVFPTDYIGSNDIVMSLSGNRIAIPGYDSVYVYNRHLNKYDYSAPYDGSFGYINLGTPVFSENDRYLCRHWSDSVIVHYLGKDSTAVIYGKTDALYPGEDGMLSFSHTESELTMSRLNLENLTYVEVQTWALQSFFESLVYNAASNAVVTISKDTLCYYTARGNRILETTHGNVLPLISVDKGADRFVTATCTNQDNKYKLNHISVWENGICVGRNYRYNDINCIALGKENSVLISADQHISVWNYRTDETFTLDASSCVVSKLLREFNIIPDGDSLYITQAVPGVEDDFYASFTYPDFSFIQKVNKNRISLCDGDLYAVYHYLVGGQSLLKVYNAKDDTLVWQMTAQNGIQFGNVWLRSGDTLYSVMDGHELLTAPFDSFIRYEILDKDDRVVLFQKNGYSVYSLSEGRLLRAQDYPSNKSIGVVETENLETGFLYADLRHFGPSDIASMKGCSWLISIDLSTGETIDSFARDGFFYLTNDGKNLLLSSENGDIQLLDQKLNVLSEMNIGEYVAGKPQKADDGYYYASSISGVLYRISFDKKSFKKVSLPHPCVSFNGRVISGRYYLLQTNEEVQSKYLYDLFEKRIVLYLLPEESVEAVEDGKVIINYSGTNPYQYLKYPRLLLSDRELTKKLKQM